MSLSQVPTEELIATALDALFMTGEMRVRLMGQTAVFIRAMADACAEAVAQPGCEVRFTCAVLNEAIFSFSVMYDTLKRMGKLDEVRTTISQIELTNGSCIVVKLKEDKCPPK